MYVYQALLYLYLERHSVMNYWKSKDCFIKGSAGVLAVDSSMYSLYSPSAQLAHQLSPPSCTQYVGFLGSFSVSQWEIAKWTCQIFLTCLDQARDGLMCTDTLHLSWIFVYSTYLTYSSNCGDSLCFSSARTRIRMTPIWEEPVMEVLHHQSAYFVYL